MERPISLWVDGSYHPELDRGGYGVVKEVHDNYQSFGGVCLPISSVYSELYAAFKALSTLPRGARVRLHTDCMHVWAGFKHPGNLHPQNYAYWGLWSMTLDLLRTKRFKSLKVIKVKSHSGCAEHNMADKIAGQCLKCGNPQYMRFCTMELRRNK